MKRNARTLLSLATALALASGATLALAQPGFGPGHGACGHMGEGRHGAQFEQRMNRHHERHQTALKAALKLTSDQESAWTKFTESTRPDFKGMPHHNSAEWDALSTPQRLEKMQALRAERDKQMDRHIEAVKQFYATLTPEQQKVFDQQHGAGHGMPQGRGTRTAPRN
jgi:periplasmic protein CpxP/Spy